MGVLDFSGIFNFPAIRFPWVANIPPMLLVVLAVVTLAYAAIFSGVLIYHWRRFPYDQHVLRRVERAYVVGCIIFAGFVVLGIGTL